MGFFAKLFGGGGGSDDDERTEALKQVLAGKLIAVVDPSQTIRRVVDLGCKGVDARVAEYSDLHSLSSSEVGDTITALLLDAKTVSRGDAGTLQQLKERNPGLVILLMIATFEKAAPGVEEMAELDGTVKKPFAINELLGSIVERLPQR